MKRLFRRDNRIAKLVAMWLVFIMLLTPLYQHSGLKNATKAATGDMEYVLPVDVSCFGAITSVDDGSTVSYHIMGDNTTHNMNYWYEGVSYTSAKITGDISGNLVYGEDTIVEYETCVKVYSGEETLVEAMTDEQIAELTTADSPVEVNIDDKYAIYVKIKDFSLDQQQIAASDSKWHLLTSYKLNPVTVGDLQWINSEGTSIGLAKNGEAAMPVYGSVSEAKDVYIGTFSYYYATKKESMDIGGYSVEELSAINPGESLTVDESGEYIGFVTYKVDSDETEISRSATVIIDKDEPDLVSWTIESGSDIQEADNGIMYLDVTDGKNYKLNVITKDDNPINSSENSYVVNFYAEGTGELVGSTTVDCNSLEENQALYSKENILPTGLELGVSYDVKVVLKDALGNEKEKKLVTICPIDATMSVIVEILDKSGAQANLVSPTKEQYKLRISVTSGNEINNIKIYDSTTSVEKPIFGITAQSERVNGIYTYTYEYNIPSDASKDCIYDGLKVFVDDKGAGGSYQSVTIDVAEEHIYDNTKPSITVAGIYIKGADGNWKLIPDKEIKDGVYKLDTAVATSQMYRFVVDVGTDTTGIQSLYAYSDSACKEETKLGEVVELTDSSIATANKAYAYEISTEELIKIVEESPNSQFTMYMQAVDGVGLKTTVGFTPAIMVPDVKLVIESAVLSYHLPKGDVIVDISKEGDDRYTNKQYTIAVKASSGYPITAFELTYQAPDGKGAYSEKSYMKVKVDQSNPKQIKYDPFTRRYEVSMDIVIPKEKLNVLLNDIVIYAVDTDSTKEPEVNNRVGKKLGTLLFDSTKPVLYSQTADEYSSETKWYKGKCTLEYVVAPGAQNTNSTESVIAVATYDIDNSVADVSLSSNGVIIPYKYNGTNNSAKYTVNVPESKSALGTKIMFEARDRAGNALKENNVIIRKVDATAPEAFVVNINGKESLSAPIGGSVKISAVIEDNLSLDYADVQITDKSTGEVVISSNMPFNLEKSDPDQATVSSEVVHDANLADGSYEVKVTVYDKAGWSSEKITAFDVDNTAPVVTAKIAAGTMGGKRAAKNYDGTACDYYYRSNVAVVLTYTEANNANVTVSDNGKVVQPTWTRNWETGIIEGNYLVKTDGLHTVKIEATDGTGNVAQSKTVTFVRDTSVPIVTATVNGALYYQETEEPQIINTDTSLLLTVSDANEDTNDLNYQVIKRVPDKEPMIGDYLKTTNRSFNFTEEAEYTVHAYSVDMAGNQSATKTVNFRIDKAAPNISIGGIENGGTSANAVTVALNMQELFWNDAGGTVKIYKKSGENYTEGIVEDFAYRPTGYNTVETRSFTESGVYRIEFEAYDKAGHNTAISSTFTIDTAAPVLTLTGVNNYDVTDQTVTITSTITDVFYASKKVTVTGTRTDIDGKVNPIVINNYDPAANPTTITESFSEDGIYDITITSVDIAGNTVSKTVHFVIDKTTPTIGDLSHIDGKILTGFKWDEDLDALVSDLTVCDVNMYLNGQVYNGEDIMEDGSYILLITAEDELGHIVEKSIEFIIDTKAPVFIVTGVEDKEKKLEPYNISVSLQLEEDTLTSVTLNGESMAISGNTSTFGVIRTGEYRLCMESVDAAGNRASQVYEFELITQKDYNMRIIMIIVAVILVLALIIFIIVKGKKRKNR